MMKSVLIKSYDGLSMSNWEKTPAATLTCHHPPRPRTRPMFSPSPTLATWSFTCSDLAQRKAAKNCGCLGSADRKSTRLNSSHGYISYAVFCLKKKKTNERL